MHYYRLYFLDLNDHHIITSSHHHIITSSTSATSAPTRMPPPLWRRVSLNKGYRANCGIAAEGCLSWFSRAAARQARGYAEGARNNRPTGAQRPDRRHRIDSVTACLDRNFEGPRERQAMVGPSIALCGSR